MISIGNKEMIEETLYNLCEVKRLKRFMWEVKRFGLHHCGLEH